MVGIYRLQRNTPTCTRPHAPSIAVSFCGPVSRSLSSAPFGECTFRRTENEGGKKKEERQKDHRIDKTSNDVNHPPPPPTTTPDGYTNNTPPRHDIRTHETAYVHTPAKRSKFASLGTHDDTRAEPRSSSSRGKSKSRPTKSGKKRSKHHKKKKMHDE